MPHEPRRYQLIERLGRGGFGTVYRARMLAAHGFEKDVAVKVLHADVPPAAVARFRDEARILGLLSDRAIVAVDAPVDLDGRWALVMEFVDGADAAAVLAEGPLPARVAVEIVGEVARALHVAQHATGPDGEPLALLHRDLKPANLRITPAGQVKILDFGVARASFEAREVRTTQHISGTPAYMAPERLQGVESAAGDIYSLGVVLHELVVGQRPEAGSVAEPTFEDVRAAEAVDDVLALSRAMRAPDPGSRPTAREVEARCEALAPTLGELSLRRWAETHVTTAVGSGARVDGALSETPSSGAAAPVPWKPLLALTGAVLVAGLGWGLRPQPTLSERLAQPLLHFVMEDNAALSERSALRRPEAWEATWVARVEADLLALAGEPAVWQRLDQVADGYGEVLAAVRERGLPEVVAGVPWVESRYMPELQSVACAKGIWQFMPWSAVNGDGGGLALRVEDCSFEDAPGVTWSPEPGPFPPFEEQVCREEGNCRIPDRLGCRVDERTDIDKSTLLALNLFDRVWAKPEIRASGAAVQLTLASHYVGSGTHEGSVESRLARHRARGGDGPQLLASPSDEILAGYSSRVTAAHLAAVCYYGANYAEREVFAPYARYVDGYCGALEVPDRAEIGLP